MADFKLISLWTEGMLVKNHFQENEIKPPCDVPFGCGGHVQNFFERGDYFAS